MTIPGALRLTIPKALLLVALLILLIVAALVVSQLRPLFQPMSHTHLDMIEVLPGSSLGRVARELNESDLIPSALAFELLARWRGVSAAIQSGEYALEEGLSPSDLLDRMVNGEQIQYRVTLVEGWTFAQALDRLWREEKLLAQLQGLTPAEIAARMGLERDNPEGLLFPDTYFYTKGRTDLDILRRANRRLNEVLSAAWETRLGALPFANSYEALIMASIIEKESAAGSERGHISGVFVRRLERGMRLQSDPTVIYGMGASYQGNITRNDLNTTTAYNTYRVGGLPPTPIALAGRESILAALNPIQSDYLYFVSRGDGSHQFSSNLEEHNAAVRQYQLQGND